MSTMLALIQEKQGAESGGSNYGDLSVFKLSQIESPSCTPPSKQALVKIYAAALNPVDIKRAAFPLDKTFPVVVGYDVAGVVEAVGDDVTDLAVGDRVFGEILPSTLGPKEAGSIAEKGLYNADLLAKIPPGVSFVAAAAVPLVAITAVQALRLAGMKPNMKVFVSAGSGGVGLHLIQIAKSFFSASEVATTASAAKTELVKKYGADKVVDYKTEDAGEVLAKWADVVVDTMGQYDMARKILNDGEGKAVSIVGASEPDIEWCLMQPNAEAIGIVASLLEEEKLVPVIDSEYSLDDAEKALERQGSGRASGKVMVKVLNEPNI